jgi:hypothetical protein
MTSGWAILEIEGDEEELKKAYAYLESKDVKIQKINAKE